MIFNPSFEKIGFIEKTHGVEGQLKISIENSISSEMEFLFLELNGDKVPFKVASINNNQTLLKLEGVFSPDFMKKLSSKDLFTIVSNTKKQPGNFEIVGYSVKNAEGEIFGEVKRVENIPKNKLIEVVNGDKAYLLPFNENFILDFDKESKEITYNLLDGMLDI